MFREIDKLVAEQVNMVYLKRVRERHPKDKIKVGRYPPRSFFGQDQTILQAIFLVGGFGASAYLREAIATAHPDIQVIQPDDA